MLTFAARMGPRPAMRFPFPFRFSRLVFVPFVLAGVACVPVLGLHAQEYVGEGGHVPYKDTSLLKVPAGARVAIYEFEDLECPACAHAFPIVHAAVERYHIPLIRHDFPLQMHVWSRDAAITARYLQDKVSPQAAEQFRGDVFKSQANISSKDDLQSFTRKWFESHKLQMPFVMDPSGRFAAEVQADETLGERIGLQHTPTIFVLYAKGWVEVMDVTQLYSVIDNALAASPATHATPQGGPKRASGKPS